jgi:predicted porin
MKKTLIASAVAAATLTSATAFAKEAMPQSLGVYGNIQLAHFWNEEEAPGGAKSGSHEFADGGSTLGFTHEHAISEGLTGFFKAEFEFDADDKGNADSGLHNTDETYIGVKGDFGSVQIGSDDTVYEQFINITDTSEQIGLGANLTTISEGDNAQYVGTFDAIKVGVTYKIDGDSTTTRGTQLAAAFETEEFYVAAAYSMASDTNYGNNKGQDAIGLAAAMMMGDLTLQAQYETLDESESGQKDGGDYMGLQGLYNMGATTFALGYGIYGTDADGATDDDQSTIYLQALHNVSDNMYVYIEAAQSDGYDNVKDQDDTATAIGATYYF